VHVAYPRARHECRAGASFGVQPAAKIEIFSPPTAASSSSRPTLAHWCCASSSVPASRRFCRLRGLLLFFGTRCRRDEVRALSVSEVRRRSRSRSNRAAGREVWSSLRASARRVRQRRGSACAVCLRKASDFCFAWMRVSPALLAWVKPRSAALLAARARHRYLARLLATAGCSASRATRLFTSRRRAPTDWLALFWPQPCTGPESRTLAGSWAIITSSVRCSRPVRTFQARLSFPRRLSQRAALSFFRRCWLSSLAVALSFVWVERTPSGRGVAPGGCVFVIGVHAARVLSPPTWLLRLAGLRRCGSLYRCTVYGPLARVARLGWLLAGRVAYGLFSLREAQLLDFSLRAAATLRAHA